MPPDIDAQAWRSDTGLRPLPRSGELWGEGNRGGRERLSYAGLPVAACKVWRQHHRPLRTSILCITLGALAACGNDDFADLQQYVTEVKSRQKEPVTPLPALRTAEPFLFRPDQIQDPFKRAQRDDESGDVAKCSANRSDPTRPKEELESFELDALRMVGTVRLHGELWGLVQAKDDTIHRVHTGSYMGLRLGRVAAVMPDRIEVIEQVQQGSCRWEERHAALDLVEPGDRK